MTEQEQKELELFKKWFSERESWFDEESAEQAWLSRAKLDINKPSWNTAPKWAKYLTQDSNGRWAWWENKPTLIEPTPRLTSIYYWDGFPGNVKYLGNHNLTKEVYEKEVNM